jgi:hypothetical protein
MAFRPRLRCVLQLCVILKEFLLMQAPLLAIYSPMRCCTTLSHKLHDTASRVRTHLL